MTDSLGLLEELAGLSGADDVTTAHVPVKAYAWARVSSEMQDERGSTVPHQLEEIRTYAKRKGIEIVQEFHKPAVLTRRRRSALSF